ncbi:MAG: hypothetical protein KAS49_02045 [Candidatus Cloacimonetes bacterium]|nr:hypothetical protein [Candidatus Cloacimonadota bacterium]
MLESIDNEMSTQLELLKKVVDNMVFNEMCQFKIKKEIQEIPWNELKLSGIYLIEVKNNNNFLDFKGWLKDFKERWEDDKYIKKFTPNFKKKRIQAHSELGKWIPLYLGKSRNISKRVNEHIYKELHKPTFAMKLFARKNMKNETFKLSIIQLEIKNYDTIVPKVESQFRNLINPLIGKQ